MQAAQSGHSELEARANEVRSEDWRDVQGRSWKRGEGVENVMKTQIHVCNSQAIIRINKYNDSFNMKKDKCIKNNYVFFSYIKFNLATFRAKRK